jgi:hypothetical protein
MLLLFIKALRAFEMRSFIEGPRQRARALVMILAMEWIRFIGLKSKISSAPSFLGKRATLRS